MLKSLNVVHYDFREAKSKVPEILSRLGVMVQSASLNADYAIGRDCLVERKTITDFISSVADGRLFRQVSELSKTCKHPLVLLEGGGLYNHGRVPKNVIRGIMIWISLSKRVPVIRTYNEHDTACVIQLLVKRYGQPAGLGLPVIKKRPISPWQQQMNVLTQIPGIGPYAAKDILNVFGSVSRMSEALDVELIAIGRLGKKRVEAIRKVFPRKLCISI